MTITSVRRVSAAQFNAAVEDAQVEGWKLQSKGDRVATLTKPGEYGSALGHIVVFVLTVWWTIGLGNLAYAGYKYMTTKKELQIKVEAPAGDVAMPGL